MKTTAVAFGTIVTIATALINFGIQLWQNDQPLVASIFFAVGGILYIVGSYYGFSKTKSKAVEESTEYTRSYVNTRVESIEEQLAKNN